MRLEQVNLLRTKCPPIGQAFRPKDNSTTHPICGLFLNGTQLVSRTKLISNVFMTKTRGPSWIEKKTTQSTKLMVFSILRIGSSHVQLVKKQVEFILPLEEKRDSGVASFHYSFKQSD
jgi:hypothetical protein